MKELIAGIVLIIVVGIGGFLYRNMLERNTIPQPEVTACTADAKICPDGSSVGRVAPLCEFAACPGEGSGIGALGITLTPPVGYVENPNALGSDETLIAAYERATDAPPPHAITVRRFIIPEGQSAESVMLAQTMLEPSAMQPESMEAFETTTIGGKTFYAIVIERFEAQVHSAYYLVRPTDVLRFDVLERNVVDWMEPTLSIKNLPEHAAFLEMLRTMTIK